MPLRILITGTSAAVSQVTKTIIDRSLHNCKSEIVDYKQLSLSAEKADYEGSGYEAAGCDDDRQSGGRDQYD